MVPYSNEEDIDKIALNQERGQSEIITCTSFNASHHIKARMTSTRSSFKPAPTSTTPRVSPAEIQSSPGSLISVACSLKIEIISSWQSISLFQIVLNV